MTPAIDILAVAKRPEKLETKGTDMRELDCDQEVLWQSPNWDCPHCRSSNMAIRVHCRSCGYDSNAGEFPYKNPLPPYENAKS